MGSKADIGESNLAACSKEVKLNRDRPMASASPQKARVQILIGAVPSFSEPDAP
jgi:hypothetical protein